MTNQLVTVHTDGRLTTTSIIIAEHFRKRHDNVLKAIRSAECSAEFNRLNFEEVSYIDAKGQKRPSYCITRDGFMFLAMGFTGKEAAMWKERFINAFNEMEEKIRDRKPINDSWGVCSSAPDAVRKYLSRKEFVINFIDGSDQVDIKLLERKSPYDGLAKAIADPANIGLKTETILEIGQACVIALANRAKHHEDRADRLSEKIHRLDPNAFQLPLKA